MSVNAAQPAPIANAMRPIIDSVIASLGSMPRLALTDAGREGLVLLKADLRERAETGKVKYGVYLQAHNGRDALVDAYQEAQDLVMYLAQAIRESTTYDPDLDDDYGNAVRLAVRLARRVRR